MTNQRPASGRSTSPSDIPRKDRRSGAPLAVLVKERIAKQYEPGIKAAGTTAIGLRL